MSKRYGRDKEPLGPKWEAVVFFAMIIYCSIILYFLG